MKKILLSFFFLLCCFASTIAQRTFSTVYTMNDGLPSNRIYSIAQDSCGLIWFGTDDGLSCFDGVNFKNYDLPASNSINKLFVDRSNRIWVGLDNGIINYDPVKNKFQPLSLISQNGEAIESDVNDIVQDRDGDIWIASNTTGLYEYHTSTNKLEVFGSNKKNRHSLLQNGVTSVSVGPNGTIWIGMGWDGFCRYDKYLKSFFRYPVSVLKYSSVQKVFEDSSGKVWIGTFQNGIWLFDPKTGKFTNFKDDSKTNLFYHIHDIREYGKGLLLVGSDNGVGLFRFANGTLERVSDPSLKVDRCANKFIYPVFVDKEGSIWSGSYFDGVELFSPLQNHFNYFSCSTARSQSGKVVNVIREYDRGKFWIGTDNNGIFRFDATKNQVTPFHIAKDIHSSYYCIHDLLVDGHFLYAATFGRGLEIFDTKTGTKKVFLHDPADPHSILSSLVFCLYKASDGYIYIGTSEGLCRYDSLHETFEPVTDFKGKIITIKEDHAHVLWIGSFVEGLIAYDLKTKQEMRFRHTNDVYSIPKDGISSLTVDPENRLWVGTYGAGICRFDAVSGRFVRYDSLNLPNKIIMSILPLGDSLWISTNNGLSVFHPSSRKLKVYKRQNGLLNQQFTFNSGILSSSGKIYMGSSDGFCSFYPGQLPENRYDPPVILTNMTVLGKDIQVGEAGSPIQKSIQFVKQIKLTHKQTMVGFDFASLSYLGLRGNRYRYKMDGLDSEWHSSTGNNNHLFYAHLPAGTYTLKIRGTNSDGYWSSKEVNLNIIVEPVFYKTVWAYSSYFVLFLILFALALTYYLRLVEKKHRDNLDRINTEKEKELYDSKIEFFTNIAHEIRTPLSLIAGPLECLDRNDSDQHRREYLTAIRQNYQRLYSLINQLLDFRKIEAKAYHFHYEEYNLKTILQNCCSIFAFYAAQKDIAIAISGIADEQSIVTDVEAFTKIVTNLLSNALKFAEKTISIEAFVEQQEIVLSISDDGIGIPESDKSRIFELFYQVKDNPKLNSNGIGIGLYLTHSLVEQMDGHIEVVNRNDGNQGISFRIYLPLRRVELEQAEPTTPFCLDEVVRPQSLMSEPSETPKKKKKYTVLLVDDNVEILGFLSQVLSKDYRLLIAQSAEQALEIVRKDSSVNLILSDVLMESQTGFDLCREIKDNIATSHIPVVLLTAKTDLQSKIEGLDSGADAYIEKPFSVSYLKACIENLLRKREQLYKILTSSPFASLHAGAVDKQDQDFIEKCNSIILSYIEDPEFSVNTLATELNMSRTSVFTKMKEVLDITPNEYIKMVRLKQACELLAEEKYQITEISLMVGFGSSSYFAKCFHKRFGMLPTEFVKDMRKTSAISSSNATIGIEPDAEKD